MNIYQLLTPSGFQTKASSNYSIYNKCPLLLGSYQRNTVILTPGSQRIQSNVREPDEQQTFLRQHQFLVHTWQPLLSSQYVSHAESASLEVKRIS